MKTCLTCKERKSETEFARNKNTKDRLQSSCKPCKRAERIAWGKRTSYQSRNPEESRAYYRKNKNMWRKRSYKNTYGITIQEIDAMIISQKGKCSICHRTFNSTKSMHLDHDHVTGQLRELLCSKCNSGIGLLDEKIERLESAIQYLKKWGAVCV